MKVVRGAIWGNGIADFADVIEGWRAQGGLQGLEVKVEVPDLRSGPTESSAPGDALAASNAKLNIRRPRPYYSKTT